MKPLMILQKNAEKGTNKIRLPKQIIEKFGRNYYLEIYEDGSMKLIPIKEK